MYGELVNYTVPLWTCRVACRDIDGVEHTVDVNAESLYETVRVAGRPSGMPTG
jgi:hypothetical protein